jgi:3-mercaptopyruvate sulfurtransferase SseA
MNKDHKVKSMEELEALFKEIDLKKPIVFYCGRGVGAAFVKAVADRFPSENIRALYDGSYPEYYSLSTGNPYLAQAH